MIIRSLPDAIAMCATALRDHSTLVHGRKWQGMEVKDKPEMATYEVLHKSLLVGNLPGTAEELAEQVLPNIPWAEDHFQERIGGLPLNPGVQWENWPYNVSADRFRTEGNQQFSHTYMERYWPRWAGHTNGGIFPDPEGKMSRSPGTENMGYRYVWGDLNDVINQLANEPDTRQAYLPIWFPEDTGVLHGGRVPCSLGYHFIRRGNHLHTTYYLRSCDFVRHFRDDIYLTLRLAQWVLEQCKIKNPAAWEGVELGLYNMHMVSLHIFKNDYRMLFHQEHRHG